MFISGLGYYLFIIHHPALIYASELLHRLKQTFPATETHRFAEILIPYTLLNVKGPIHV